MINATSCSFQNIEPVFGKGEARYAMDVSLSPKSLFLKRSMKQGSHAIYGYEMYALQAFYQYRAWFKQGKIGQESFLKMVADIVFFESKEGSN